MDQKRKFGEGLLTFSLAEHLFAVRTDAVSMIEMVTTITRVPHCAPILRGVAAVRGQVLPVLSLRSRLGLPADELSVRSRLLVVHVADRTLALLVDAARTFLQANEASITAFPRNLRIPGAEWAEGLVLMEARPIVLLDIGKMVREDQTMQHAAAEENTAGKA